MITLCLGELIAYLETKAPDVTVPNGFGEPMSYRGDYANVAFKPASDVKIGDMLQHAKSALGKTFEGYKGGDFTMHKHSKCYLAHYGDLGNSIDEYMVGNWEITCIRAKNVVE